MADADPIMQALRQPLGERLQLFPPLSTMDEETHPTVLRQPLGEQRLQLFPPLSTMDEGTQPIVLRLLAEDEEEIVAGRSFTQCDRIKESNCIHHSQYIQLLRMLGSNRLLDSSESNVAKRLVDIKPYVLLLRRLILNLVQYYPKDDNTRDLNCTPNEFLKILGADLLHTKVVVGAEDPPDDMGLHVTGNINMYIDYLQQIVSMLQR